MLLNNNVEEKMLNREKGLGLLILFFGFISIVNLEAQTDNRLNGTWVSTTEGVEVEMRIQNGNIEALIDGVLAQRSTYTTNNREITTVGTHIHGGVLISTMGSAGIDLGLESRWYSADEIIITFRAFLLKRGVSEREVNVFVQSVVSGFEPETSQYLIDSDTLVMITTVQRQSTTTIFTRR
jgi:hypothetical protein